MDKLLTLSNEFGLDGYQWGMAFLATFIAGFSKAGIKGLGVLVVTLMAIVFESKTSTGIVLAIFIFADVLAVIYYNKKVKWKYLFKFLPWMIVGILIGVYLGKDMPEQIFKKGMAGIILISVILMWWWEYKNDLKVPDNKFFASIMGLTAGFTTMVGNLAGAFSNIYFLALRVPKIVFIGTTAWLFFIINLFKMPFHIWVWETVSIETVPIVLRLLPAMFIGFIIGVKLVDKIPEQTFRKIILILTAFGAFMIFLK